MPDSPGGGYASGGKGIDANPDQPDKALEATYSLKDPKDFAEFLTKSNIRLVRAKFLAELVLQKRPLPRRQELESETFVVNGQEQTALVKHPEVQNWAAGSQQAIICSISHAWETREHADPSGYQLQHIVNRVGLYELAFKAEAWVFYDYASLFQFQRESSEEGSFRAAMGDMHLLYAHECTLTLRIESITPDEVWENMKSNEKELIPVYDMDEKCVKAKPLKDLVENRVKYLDRGWCMAEVEWSSVRSVNAQHQPIDKVQDPDQDLNGRVPLTPESFRAKMEKAAFTHRSDAESVIHLQKKIFFQKVTACEDLVLEGLPVEEIVALARVLPLYRRLRRLTLRNVRCGEEEAEAFGKALASTAVEMIKVDNSEQSQQSGVYLSNIHLAKAVAAALMSNESFNKSLTHIDFGGNAMFAEGTKVLLEALKHNKSVTHIDLKVNQIDVEGAKALAEILKSNPSVTNIDLCGGRVDSKGMAVSSLSDIGMEGAKALAEALKDHKSVTHINLAQCGVCAEGAEALAVALALNTSVTHINLSKNKIGPEGAEAFRKALESNTTLAFIDLTENRYTSVDIIDIVVHEIKDEDIQALEEALKRNRPTVTTNSEDGSGAGQGKSDRMPFEAPIRCKALAEALKINASASQIDLRDDAIGPEGAQALKTLKTNTSVSFLDLTGNQIGPEGAQDFAEVLKINTLLTVIYLKENAIGPEGAQALAEALKTNTTVTEIYLKENAIGPEGAQALAEALKINTSVTYIDLDSNAIGCEGAQALAEALKINTSVTTIRLEGNAIGGEGFQALAEALKMNTSLTQMFLAKNKMKNKPDREGYKALERVMDKKENFEMG